MPTIHRRTSSHEDPERFEHKNPICKQCFLEKPCDCPEEDDDEE